MSFLDRLMPWRALPVMEPNYAVMASSYGSSTIEMMQPTFPSFAGEGYQGNAIVFALILKRMSVFSEARLQWQSLDGSRTWGSGDLGLLERPWPGGTTGELLARMEQDVSLAGNAFIRRVGDRLERLRPDWVDIVQMSSDDPHEPTEVVGYQFWRDGRGGQYEPIFLDVSEVAHWSPIPDPLAQWRGMSWLTPVVREINADSTMTVHKQAFFDNAATPNLIIRYQQKLDPDAVERLRRRWSARHGGSGNSGKTAILDEGADMTVVGNSFEQMAFTAVQSAGENRIAAAAGVPGIVVGLKEGLDAATYSNFEQAMRAFADTFLRPQWRSVCACLSKLVDVPNGAELWYDESRVAALRQGEKERAETMQVQAAAALNLINAGYKPDTVTIALASSDLSKLSHSGAIPTALYPEGKVPESQGGSE